MAKMVCIKRHFGKGGELVPVGAEANGKPDGTFWVAATKADEKKLEVATPKKADAKAES